MTDTIINPVETLLMFIVVENDGKICYLPADW